MRYSLRIALVLIAFSPLLMGADNGCVMNPPNDSIVLPGARPVTLVMTGSQGLVDGQVELTVQYEAEAPRSYGFRNTSGGQVTFPGVDFSRTGKYVFGGRTQRVVDGVSTAGGVVPQQVHVRNDIWDRGKQEVGFFYFPIAEQHMRDIAINTLAAPLSTAQLNEFVAGVKAKTRQIFEQLYAPYDVVLVDQQSPGSDGIVWVTFGDKDLALAPGTLGTTIESPIWDLTKLHRAIPDFNNQWKTQYPRVFLGSVKDYMLSGDNFIALTAAERSDTLEQRIRDLGVVLGVTAAHEVGHTLGLVIHSDLIEEIAAVYGVPVADAVALAKAVGVKFPLPDLDGCRMGHNCPAPGDPLTKRFGAGYHVMDTGPEIPYHAYFGFKNADTREEQLPIWESFSHSYLSIIHPKP